MKFCLSSGRWMFPRRSAGHRILPVQVHPVQTVLRDEVHAAVGEPLPSDSRGRGVGEIPRVRPPAHGDDELQVGVLLPEFPQGGEVLFVAGRVLQVEGQCLRVDPGEGVVDPGQVLRRDLVRSMPWYAAQPHSSPPPRRRLHALFRMYPPSLSRRRRGALRPRHRHKAASPAAQIRLMFRTLNGLLFCRSAGCRPVSPLHCTGQDRKTSRHKFWKRKQKKRGGPNGSAASADLAKNPVTPQPAHGAPPQAAPRRRQAQPAPAAFSASAPGPPRSSA